MQNEENLPDDAVLRSSVAEALRMVLSRSGSDQAAAEVLTSLRWQLAKALADAPMTTPAVEAISVRARLAAAFETVIEAQEVRLGAREKGLVQAEERVYREKRRWPRQTVHLSAEVSTDGSTVNCIVVDLSKGGAQVDFANPAPVSALVTLKIANGETRLARRRWVRGTRAGFEFV